MCQSQLVRRDRKAFAQCQFDFVACSSASAFGVVEGHAALIRNALKQAILLTGQVVARAQSSVASLGHAAQRSRYSSTFSCTSHAAHVCLRAGGCAASVAAALRAHARIDAPASARLQNGLAELAADANNTFASRSPSHVRHTDAVRLETVALKCVHNAMTGKTAVTSCLRVGYDWLATHCTAHQNEATLGCLFTAVHPCCCIVDHDPQPPTSASRPAMPWTNRPAQLSRL